MNTYADELIEEEKRKFAEQVKKLQHSYVTSDMSQLSYTGSYNFLAKKHAERIERLMQQLGIEESKPETVEQPSAPVKESNEIHIHLHHHIYFHD